MKNRYAIGSFIQAALWGVAGLLIFSCTQNPEQQNTAQVKKPLSPPQIIILANLPDSSKPKVTLLADMPKPKIVNAKPGKIHSFIDKSTQLPLAPEVQGIGFFTTYTTNDGLTSDLLQCSAMDHVGNLWFGSINNGVSKYDGKAFTNYTVAQGLASNYVNAILEDKAGNLWFATMGGGVSKYDGKTFTTFTSAQGLPSNDVLRIIEDRRGNLWFSTMSDGVSQYDGQTFTNYTTRQGLALNLIWNMLEDREGNLWFSTDNAGVSKFDGKRFTTYTTAQGLISNDVYSILEDGAGNLWFGTMGKGLSKYDGKTFTTYSTAQGLTGKEVLCSRKDRAGNLWFGTYTNGVSKFDGHTFTNFTIAQGLVNNYVTGIIEDKQSNIWICTYGGGVSKYSGKSFTMYKTAQGLGSNMISSISEDNRGNLWFGTTNGGITKFDGKQLATYTTAQGLANDNILNHIVDKAGNLWISVDGEGISKFDGKQFTTYTTAQGLSNNYVGSMLEDKGGNLWLGTMGGGVSRFDGKRFTTYTTAQGLASNYVFCILEDGADNLWFGTNGSGISKFDGKQFTTYTTAQGLTSNNVLSMLEDKTGNLWLGTEQGLSVIPSGKLRKEKGKNTANEGLTESLFNTFTTNDGLPDNTINSIIEDTQGRLLIGSNLGIAVLKDGIRSFGMGTIDVYHSTTGYPMQAVGLLFADRKGISWLSTGSDKTGLMRFDSKALHTTRNTPVLVLQNVKINNETICWNDLLPTDGQPGMKQDSLTTPAAITEEVNAFGRVLRDTEREKLRRKFGDSQFDSLANWYPIPQNLVLPHRHNTISFDFNAVETSRNFMVRYQYKLDGYDEDWSALTDKTSATFGNMYEGTYTFRVKARSPEGIWSKPITYIFTVLPPWWRTWWAYTLYLLVLIGSVSGLIYYRSAALRRENRVLEEKVNLRTRQLQQKSSDLEKSLTTLKTTQNQLVHKEKMASLGELTAGIAHEIQNPLNFVNNFSELSSELVEELEEERHKTARDPALEVELLTDLKDNLSKILHHGNRAASIVKGMLEHSRSSTGEMQATDLNSLTQEYLRLAYHGLRANDKSFNCELVTEFDPTVGSVDIMPQEIGRVLLNLFSNAFYAVRQKQQMASADYQPTVSVHTGLVDGQAVVQVLDNGTGMSKPIQQKIFQPFFTTKPTGQGTGLGLSLSYDIVTKGHGGTLTVSSQEGQGTEFTLSLPIHSSPA